MCQCQLSSPELASGAAMPPWAATVCERVGNTFERTATFRLARASSSAARMPAPPAPTTIASNRRTGRVTSAPCESCLSPEDLDRPGDVARERQENRDFEEEPQPGGLHVVHQHVAHAHPGVPGEAAGEEERGHAHPALLEHRAPGA